MSKENDTCINKAWNTYTESELMERKISPFGKMNIQIADMISKIVSEYDQEIPQSQTADNHVAPRGRAAQPPRDTRKTN